MSDIATETEVALASGIMARFAERTGLASDAQGDPARRYLWTDAFALLNFLALKAATDDKSYDAFALRVMKEVHCHLGKFARQDSRVGWLSGFEGDEARQHPTIGGLRIGKKLPERSEQEAYDSQQEWDRDGQYYHYHTRWITALLTAASHFDECDYFNWAAELSLVGGRFIEETKSGLRMYWKMSVDLSRPLVPMMGAHDPLEGLLCALQAREVRAEEYEPEFERYINQLKQLCARSRWATDDELGLGALALNVVRAAQLQTQTELPDSIHPRTLLEDVEKGLVSVTRNFHRNESANYRLAFRECGLSLGLRCLEGNLSFLKQHNLKPDVDDRVWQLADDIESFWLDEKNQQAATFQDHLDINEVSLASSLLAKSQPELFTRS